MMETVYILVGLGLAVCGIIVACITKKGRSKRTRNVPPPLPPRANTNTHTSLVSPPLTRTSNSTTTRTLPPRRSSASAIANANPRSVEVNCGPRGVKPTQFPCCPFDKQRNVPGERQVIFWDSGASCYRCSRGHRFKSNGKLL